MGAEVFSKSGRGVTAKALKKESTTQPQRVPDGAVSQALAMTRVELEGPGLAEQVGCHRGALAVAGVRRAGGR
jgi:hypothetical protein